MEVYNKIIDEVRNTLSPFKAKELSIKPDTKWTLLENSEYLMGREVAFELGDRQKPSACFNCVTSSDAVSEDRILLYGPDLSQIKKNTNFTRITLLNVNHVEDPNDAYMNIKHLEFERFNIRPEGYMMLSSSVENKEQVRVSKKAIKNGLSFETIGNLIVNHYKAEPTVNNVQVIFITEDLPIIPELVKLGYKVDEITDAFDHILKDVILDCDMCPLQSICEEVEGMKELHFKNEALKKAEAEGK